MTSLNRKAVLPLIRAALREDQAARDVTSRAVLPASTRIRARLIAKAPGVLAGGPVAAWTFQALDPSIRCVLRAREGAALKPGRMILTLEGRARSIFAAERVALNVLGHLSGIATMTRAFVREARGTPIFDTRKTLPGLRRLEKHAVRAGGGHSHRANLREAILIKTNHLRAASSEWGVVSREDIKTAVTKARRIRPKKTVEIEVTNFREFAWALDTRPDVILLDNWRPADVRRAVALRAHSLLTTHYSPLLEVSGGVTLANVGAIAHTGVDRISIGRLTHSAPSLNLSLEIVSDTFGAKSV